MKSKDEPSCQIRAFVPDASFQQYFGPTVAGLFLTLLATTILEVCSEVYSPIAADLVKRARAWQRLCFPDGQSATDFFSPRINGF